MTRSNDRILNSGQFKRHKATEDTKRKITAWEIWECNDPISRHVYDRRVSLYVHQGAAAVTFDDGETVDLQPGDFLTIEKGANATWVVSEPIRNSFVYHDSFISASNRTVQLRRQGK